MAIRLRLNGDMVCAAMTEAEPDDCYINDTLHYQLSVISRAILADAEHESNGLWHWVHSEGGRLRAIKEY